LGTHWEQQEEKKTKNTCSLAPIKKKKTGSEEVTNNPSAVPKHRMIQALHVLDLFCLQFIQERLLKHTQTNLSSIRRPSPKDCLGLFQGVCWRACVLL